MQHAEQVAVVTEAFHNLMARGLRTQSLWHLKMGLDAADLGIEGQFVISVSSKPREKIQQVLFIPGSVEIAKTWRPDELVA